MSKRKIVKIFSKIPLIKVNSDLDYWDIRPSLATNPLYIFAYGERGNGKTTTALLYMLEEYYKSGYTRRGAIVRRWLEDFKGFNGPQMFDFINQTTKVSEITNDEYNTVVYKARQWFLAKFKDGELLKIDAKPFIYGFSIVSQDHYKSTQFPDVYTMLFDECISAKSYLPDEFISFMSLVSTIKRNKTDFLVIMLGNTISKFCPYFREMGLNRVKKQPQGTIDVYNYGDSGLRVAVEYCKPSGKSKESNAYFAFDNPKLEMIKTGGWQIANYPRLPVEYRPSDVKYIFYIAFYEELFQCNVIYMKSPRCQFIYIHPKTSNIYDTKALIFDTIPHAENNYRRRITKPTDDLTKRLYKFFVDEKVFYATNETGDTIHNYLEWCKKESY